MEKNIRKWQILGIAAMLAILWLIVVATVFPTFQNSRYSDPLAEINSLFPFFFVIIAALAMLSLYVSWKKIDSWKIQLVLLTEFAFVLWFTPYLMSGFIKEPDSIWHSSIGLNIGEVLSGNQIMFSEYASQFPGSYIISNFLLQVTGLDVAEFVAFVFPAFYIFIIVLLMFILSKKFLGSRYGFLATLASIPAIHYLKLYCCPSSIGLVLILTLIIMALFNRSGLKNIGVISLIFLILVISYPVYPLFFIGATGILLVSYRIYNPKGRKLSLKLLTSIGTIVLAVWIAGASILGDSFDGGLLSTTVRAFKNLFGAGIGGGAVSSGLVYPEIFYINVVVYAMFGLAVLFFLLLFVIISVRKNLGIKGNIKNILKLHGEQKTLILFFVFLTGIMTLLLGMISFTLIERGLTMLILLCMIYILKAYSFFIKMKTGEISNVKMRLVNLVRSRHRWAAFAAILLFLTMTQPIIGYSIDAYTSFPQSENHGLEHLANTVDFDNINISISMPGQLAYYIDEDDMFEFRTSPIVDVDGSRVYLFVYRRSGYYFTSMRVENNFENNSFTQSLANINEHVMYNKVFDSGTIEIFIHN